jgi:cell wall assembly regulator SMI1
MHRAQKIGISIILGIIVIIMGVMWAEKKVLTFLPSQTFLYPLAPPMPAVVDESMPEILAHLESVLKTNAPQVLATLRPGISPDQISQLEQQYHVQLPDDIAAIYEWHDGAAAMSTTNYLDFIPIHRFVPLEEMLSEKDDETKGQATATPVQKAVSRTLTGFRDNWYCLFDDGTGNGYYFDPTRKPAEGAVFSGYVEDNDYTFFPSPKNLMAGIAKCYGQGAFRIKPGSEPLQLDEDFDQAAKIWKEFGAGNQETPSSGQ